MREVLHRAHRFLLNDCFVIKKAVNIGMYLSSFNKKVFYSPCSANWGFKIKVKVSTWVGERGENKTLKTLKRTKPVLCSLWAFLVLSREPKNQIPKAN